MEIRRQSCLEWVWSGSGVGVGVGVENGWPWEWCLVLSTHTRRSCPGSNLPDSGRSSGCIVDGMARFWPR